MDRISRFALRITMGITFLWIGILIFQEPAYWSSFMQPWAEKLLIVPAEQAMIATAALDVLVGILLLLNRFVWVAGALGTFHLIVVLVVSGVDAITVRDIGLLGGTIALFWSDLPEKYKKRFAALRR